MEPLRSQRIYAKRRQFRLGGDETYSFSGTVHLETETSGYVIRQNMKIPVERPGLSWKVCQSWQSPQMSLFEVA